MLISALLNCTGWLVSYQENSRKSEGDEASNPAGVDNFETSAGTVHLLID